MARGGAKPGERRGGRKKGTPNKVTAATREAILAEIERRAELGEQANPFIVAMDVMRDTQDEHIKLQAAAFIGDRILPRLRAVEHSGSVEHQVEIQVVLE